jgi:sulfate adenylyltransferase subunit 2
MNRRRRLAVALRLKGHSLQQAAEEAGISPPTVVAAWKAWQQGGWDAVDTRPRGRKPADEQRLTPDEHAQFIADMLTGAAGLCSLKRCALRAADTFPGLKDLAPTQREPMVQRLLQRAELIPPNAWDRWREDSEPTLRAWMERDLPPLRQLVQEMDAHLLALSERTLPGREGAQLAAHTLRGTAYWWHTPAWPRAGDWRAFLQALHREIDEPLWLLCRNPHVLGHPTVTALCSAPGTGIRLVPVPPAADPLDEDPA